MMSAVLALSVALALAACSSGSYVLIASMEQSGADHWSLSYKKFDGFKERSFSLSGEEETTVTIAVETHVGALAVSVEGKDGVSYFMQEDMETSENTFTVDAGETKLTVRLEAEEHSGGIDIHW